MRWFPQPRTFQYTRIGNYGNILTLQFRRHLRFIVLYCLTRDSYSVAFHFTCKEGEDLRS